MGVCMSTLFLDHDTLDEIIEDATGNTSRHAEDNGFNKCLIEVVLAGRRYQTSLREVAICCLLIPDRDEIGWAQVQIRREDNLILHKNSSLLRLISSSYKREKK